jgi:hypothetical protein
MAKMNPGWDQKTKHQILNPELTGTPNVGLVDWIVREKLFNFFLQDGCVPLTKEHRLFEKIVTNNDLPKPIAVWGYDNSIHAFGGSLYEAEVRRAKRAHKMSGVGGRPALARMRHDGAALLRRRKRATGWFGGRACEEEQRRRNTSFCPWATRWSCPSAAEAGHIKLSGGDPPNPPSECFTWR